MYLAKGKLMRKKYELTTLCFPGQQDVVIHKNQSMVIVNKPKYESDFLQIGISEWHEAARNLKDCSLKLYFYMASNMNGYKFALSHTAVKNAIGMSKGAYHNALTELKQKGYLLKQFTKDRDGYETWYFYTTPQAIDVSA